MALPNPPLNTPIVEDGARLGAVRWAMTKPFADWLLALVQRVSTAAYQLASISRTSQTAAVTLATVVPTASGLYKISYRARVVTPASTSSSLQVQVASTEGGVACLQSSTAYTGNATNRPLTGLFLVRADAGTPIQVSTQYASVGTPMAYDLDCVAEALA